MTYGMIVLERLTVAFPSRRLSRAVYERFEIAPKASIYVPHNHDRAHISWRALWDHARFPNNERLRDFCEARCQLYESGRINEYRVLPHQIDRVIDILQVGL